MPLVLFVGVISALLDKELKPVGSPPVLPSGRFFPLVLAYAPSSGFFSSIGALAAVSSSFCLSIPEVFFFIFLFVLSFVLFRCFFCVPLLFHLLFCYL